MPDMPMHPNPTRDTSGPAAPSLVAIDFSQSDCNCSNRGRDPSGLIEIPTMTEEHKASRTLVKSAPELWAECSVADSLARHLGEFGEIKITRLEPETTVAWEGTRASGTVRLEPSGWGTQVTLTAVTVVDAEPAPVAAEPAAAERAADHVDPRATEVKKELVEPAAVVAPVAVVERRPPAAVAEPQAAVAAEPVVAAAPPRRRLIDRLRWFFNGPQPQPEVAREPAAGDPLPAVVDPEPAAVQPGPVAVQPGPVAVEPEPVAVEPVPVAVGPEPVAVEPEPVAVEPESATEVEDRPDPTALLTAALDSLGQAHHRPFSRA
jgi:hypothetical protein